MNKTLALTQQLIAKASVTPNDQGCQEILIQRLQALDFKIERLPFGDVNNFWARRGNEGPLFAFAGHTDVVPPGPLEQWQSHPYAPEIRDGLLYGRGAADMKASLAAMITATENFVTDKPQHTGSIAFLITSDEEGLAVDGTRRVIDHLEERSEKITWCLVGEPSSSEKLGDTLKNGRRGSLSGKLIVYGHQGHIAYPHLADNPIHRLAPASAELCASEWDSGNTHFPPTSFQISNINAGTGAGNVIPGRLDMDFNFRYSPETTHSELKMQVETLLDRYGFDYEILWNLYGEPFYTQPGKLTEACADAIHAQLGYRPLLSTAGGTSDGRFIALTGAQVIELGPVNASIHKINEHIAVADLEKLARIYQAILQNLLTS